MSAPGSVNCTLDDNGFHDFSLWPGLSVELALAFAAAMNMNFILLQPF
jgi:hypothetical protein